jgi:O-acetyl-ADP-ribose deacetylase (regulator of RNase III)
MKIEVCIRDRFEYQTAKDMFNDEPNIIVTNNTITNGKYSTLISAGNSFGQMNGGVDGIINMHLSAFTPTEYIHQSVQEYINEKYVGELPVGQSIVIKTKHPTHKHLVYSPTMRVAEDVSGSLNAYLAFRGGLLAMRESNINEASTPLFCTGAGCMSVEKACKQMKEAYKTVVNKKLVGCDWIGYHEHHRYLYSLHNFK